MDARYSRGQDSFAYNSLFAQNLDSFVVHEATDVLGTACGGRDRVLRDELASLRAVAVVELRIKGSDLHGMGCDLRSCCCHKWICLDSCLRRNAIHTSLRRL